MYANILESLQEIVLPQISDKGYDIMGKWFTADGKWTPLVNYGNRNGTRITKNMNGTSIYRNKPESSGSE